MSKELKILYVEDDEESRNNLIDLLTNEEINNYRIFINGEKSFAECVQKVNDYHIVILDLFEGRPGADGKPSGLAAWDKIRENIFIPIIFPSIQF